MSSEFYEKFRRVHICAICEGSLPRHSNHIICESCRGHLLEDIAGNVFEGQGDNIKMTKQGERVMGFIELISLVARKLIDHSLEEE